MPLGVKAAAVQIGGLVAEVLCILFPAHSSSLYCLQPSRVYDILSRKETQLLMLHVVTCLRLEAVAQRL
jgi:hypothetical protein